MTFFVTSRGSPVLQFNLNFMLPTVRKEWLRAKDFYPGEFLRKVSRVSKGVVSAVS